MKIMIRILTIYIFVLSLVPCGDGGGGIVVIAKQLFGIEAQNSIELEQDYDTCENAPCSPFCICSGCFTALDTAKEIRLPEKIVTTIPKTTPSFIKHFYPSIFNHSIWQPPKLG